MCLLHGDVSHVHRNDAYYINVYVVRTYNARAYVANFYIIISSFFCRSSDGDVRIRERAPELLVLGESLLLRKNIGGPAVPSECNLRFPIVKPKHIDSHDIKLLQIVYSIAYVMIVYFITSQPLETERFLMYLNICILTSLVAQSIGLLIGAAMSVEVRREQKSIDNR